MQGGIIMTLADQAISGAVGTVNPGFRSVTVEMKLNFIAPAQSGVLIGEGRVTHRGNLLSVGEATIKDEDGRLIAQAMGTWMTLRPPPSNPQS